MVNSTFKDNQTIICPFNSTISSLTCPVEFTIVNYDIKLNQVENNIIFKEYYPSHISPLVIPFNSNNYCIGFELNNHFSIKDPLKENFVYCMLPCNEQTPCLRTCCEPGRIFIDGHCKIEDYSEKHYFKIF